MTLERVQKFIAESGFCSRRKAEEFIAKGCVKVNNKIVKLGDKCTKDDKISINGRLITTNSDSKDLYIVMNKPKGYVCSKDDPHNPKTIFDLVKSSHKKGNLNYAGRLDKDTTGLIILSTNGQFINKIIHPSSKIVKTYTVEVDKPLSQANINKLERGIKIDNYQLTESKIVQLSDLKYRIIINEGKNRQIRKMMETVQKEVTSLNRDAIGNLKLKDLRIPLGTYKLLEKKELESKIW